MKGTDSWTELIWSTVAAGYMIGVLGVIEQHDMPGACRSLRVEVLHVLHVLHPTSQMRKGHLVGPIDLETLI